jgi:hypothetical protein
VDRTRREALAIIVSILGYGDEAFLLHCPRTISGKGS